MIITTDLWMTLIRPNPLFRGLAYERVWKKYFGVTELSVKKMKDYFTRLDEITGRHSTLIERYHYLSIEGGKYPDYDKIYPDLEAIFLENIPLPYDETIIPTLSILKESGISVGIISNTGVIEGRTLDKVIKTLFPKLIDYCAYSDVTGMAKPNPRFFDERAHLHIGDNPIADGGCQQIGIPYLQINTNDKQFSEVLNYCSTPN